MAIRRLLFDSSKFHLILLMVVANSLLLTPPNNVARLIGALVLLLLPGLVWVEHLLPQASQALRWLIGAGLSYAILVVGGLVLHYLPGSLPLGVELVVFNLLILLPILNRKPLQFSGRPSISNISLILGGIICLAAFFRLANLGYSEFQGDEVKALLPAAKALAGQADALFWGRKKGPVEILIPMLLWPLTGAIDEFSARFPFALAGLLIIPTIYLLGSRLLSKPAGLIAAGLIALNGFMVAFSRIVQYQIIVTWMSLLALLCVWQWRESGHKRWMILAGLFLATGLLGHYDALAIIPALLYLGYTAMSQHLSSPTTPDQRSNSQRPIFSKLYALVAGGISFLIVTGLFYVPYLFNPQVSQTADYLDRRIGSDLLKNKLVSFLQLSIFYHSFYYIAFIGLLALAFLAWALVSTPGLRNLPGRCYWLPLFACLTVLGLMFKPYTLRLAETLDVAAIPFALIFLGAFLSSSLTAGERALIVWFAATFLVYNFALILPLTHIYTIMPAWTLLSGAALIKLWHIIKARTMPAQKQQPAYLPVISALISIGLIILFSGYLYIAYLRHDVEFRQDWPDSRVSLYWSPYGDALPEGASGGYFGFIHNAGWKSIATLYANGQLSGAYDSNEHEAVTSWYTRQTPRASQAELQACAARPEYYFMADDLAERWPTVDEQILTQSYEPTGRITLPNGKGLTIYQIKPAVDNIGQPDIELLAHTFDQTATPGTFIPSNQASYPIRANLQNAIRLLGYDIISDRAWPGGEIVLTLYWQAQVFIPFELHVFAHLEGHGQDSPAGIWAQSNGTPACGLQPTNQWSTDQIIVDRHTLTISPETPISDYSLLAGMYLPENGIRLEVLDEAGAPVANFVKLTTVSVRAKPEKTVKKE